MALTVVSKPCAEKQFLSEMKTHRLGLAQLVTGER
jgi:hypothetical protein